MTPGLRAYASLTAANVRMLLRNPLASFSIFLALLVLLGFFKVIAGQTVRTRVVLVDGSATPAAVQLAADIRAVASFDVSPVTAGEAERRLRAGQADLSVTLPARVGGDEPARLAVRYRAGSPGEAAVPVLRGVVEGFDERVLHQVPPVAVDPAPVAARTVSTADVLLPGVIAFNIIGGALMVAAGVFSGYKSSGVLRRLKATGISPSTFVLAHATSAFAVGLAQTAAIVAVSAVLFGIHLDVPALLVLVVLGYAVFLALGLAIGGWIRDAQRASAVAQAVAFPMIFVALLSAALPPSIAAVTRYLPVSPLTDGFQQLGQGAGLTAVGADVLWLAAWAAVLLAAAGRVFRWE